MFENKWLIHVLIVFAVFVIYESCTKVKVEEELPIEVPEELPTLSKCDSLISISDGWYECQVKPIILDNCASAGCHVQGGSGPGNFETYTGLKSAVDAGTFEYRVIYGAPSPMPAQGLLPDSILQIFQAWINKGAPNN